MMNKTDLIAAIANSKLGKDATFSEKQAINAAIANLEDFNPTPRPVEARDLLDGNWRLIYTTSSGLLNLNRIPLSKLGSIYQCIRVQTTSVYNIAEIYGLPFLEGLISVAANFNPINGRRVEVKFKRSIIGFQRLIDYTCPEKFIQEIETGKKFPAIDFPINTSNQQGWLDTTYLDSDLRIGRGNEGSIFVLTKA